ncbi:NAD(P)-dependent oxidoreductase [Aestuariibius sp. 2305UL40-4]|uniref:NAD(P)-dependent oxidoreductase n=1 Tax=Aestuariibius violaceus TaxID=3234132 RepID=UPI00345E143B
MKVLIIGATGKIGRHTLAEVVALGHDVTAFGRSVSRIEPFERLTIVKGDVTNAQDLAAVMPSHDAVILTFGAPLNWKTVLVGTDVCETGTRAVITAMQAAQVPRLVAMTSIGAGNSSGHGSWPFRNVIKPVLLGRIMRDRTAQERVVRESGLPEWVIVRPAELTDGPKNTNLREFTSFDGIEEPSAISRLSVAAYLAGKVSDKSHDNGAVLISD